MPENLRLGVDSLTGAFAAAFGGRECQKRAKIASTGYGDGWNVIVDSAGKSLSKLLKELAEGTGLEPARPCGRRFSRPLHYQLCDPSAWLTKLYLTWFGSQTALAAPPITGQHFE